MKEAADVRRDQGCGVGVESGMKISRTHGQGKLRAFEENSRQNRSRSDPAIIR